MDIKELEEMLLEDTQRLDELSNRMDKDKIEMLQIRSRQSLMYSVLIQIKKRKEI